MTPAEYRILNELNRSSIRRVVERQGARWLEITSIGGNDSYGAALGDPKHWRFSRRALASLRKKGFLCLARTVGGTVPQNLYAITPEGIDALLAESPVINDDVAPEEQS